MTCADPRTRRLRARLRSPKTLKNSALTANFYGNRVGNSNENTLDNQDIFWSGDKSNQTRWNKDDEPVFCKTTGGLERGRDYLRYRLRKQRLYCRVVSVLRIGAASCVFEDKHGIKQNKKTQTNKRRNNTWSKLTHYPVKCHGPWTGIPISLLQSISLNKRVP